MGISARILRVSLLSTDKRPQKASDTNHAAEFNELLKRDDLK